jgi:membrane-bound metal-dependent hydrolase YbcI (DUF457 family)
MDNPAVMQHVSLLCKRLMRNPGWLAGMVVVGDAFLTRKRPGLAIAGAIDETAHLATTLLIGGPCPESYDPVAIVGLTLGSVLIDVDHVPLLLFRLPMESAEDRPVTHSLVTLAVLIGATRLSTGNRRSFLLGLTAGTTSHFLRDLATGGAPLAWPLTRRLVTAPYLAYAVLLAGLALRAIVFNQSTQRPPHCRGLPGCKARSPQTIVELRRYESVR